MINRLTPDAPQDTRRPDQIEQDGGPQAAVERLGQDRFWAEPFENTEPDIGPDEQRPVLLPDENDYPPETDDPDEHTMEAWYRR